MAKKKSDEKKINYGDKPEKVTPTPCEPTPMYVPVPDDEKSSEVKKNG